MKTLTNPFYCLMIILMMSAPGLVNGQTSGQSAQISDFISVPWFETRPGIILPKETSEIFAVIYNPSGEYLQNLVTAIEVPADILLNTGLQTQLLDLRPQEVKRFVWLVTAKRIGSFKLKLTIKSNNDSISSVQSLKVVLHRDPRHEYMTSAGTWEVYPHRPLLQEDNANKIEILPTLPSSRIRSNKFGITAHIPRSIDEEDPFSISHLVDGDPGTCWSSRWWRVPIPFTPETIELDLGEKKEISEFGFLPSWMNAGAPAALKIESSDDGNNWVPVFDEPDYSLQEVAPGDPLRYNEQSWQRISLPNIQARYLRLVVARLRSGHTSFFCSPVEPYQLRIAEISIFNLKGEPVDIKNCVSKVSSTFHAWYNSPETINRTYPFLFSSGVKWNRTGQWGDKTDWATVEKIRGVYTIDPEMDQAITESVNKGVNIMMGLNYGNLLYQKMKDPVALGPTWHRGHPFLQCAPTTDEAIEGFVNYCGFMANHFRGRVKYYEIWNEENGWFMDAWADNNSVRLVKDYGRALLAAAKAIKETDPEALIVFGGVAGSSLDFPRIAFDQGAGPYIDVFAFHPYGHPTPEAAPPHFLTETNGMMEWKPRPAEISDYEEEIGAFRELLHQYNPKMEIWANEMNWMAPGEPFMKEFNDGSELSQAKYLARFFTMNASLNCGAIWWSLYNENNIQEWAVIRTCDMSPRGAYFSASYVSSILDDSQPTTKLEAMVVGKAPEDLKIKYFRKGNNEWLIALWTAGEALDDFKPEKVTIRVKGKPVNTAELEDALYGYRQQAVFKQTPDGAIFKNLLVGDWPLIIRSKSY
jgi:hypothetical protein